MTEPGGDQTIAGDREPWRPFTVPNAITMVRLLLIPVYVWLLFGRDDREAAAYLLGTLGATDWVDGWFARRYGQVSLVGKILDPIADRLLLGTAVVTMLIDGSMPRWVAILVLIREGAVSLATVTLAALGANRLDVTFVGKSAAFANMLAFPAFLIAESTAGWADIARPIAWISVAIGLGLGYWSLADYVPKGRQALAEGRAARAARPGDGS